MAVEGSQTLGGLFVLRSLAGSTMQWYLGITGKMITRTVLGLDLVCILAPQFTSYVILGKLFKFSVPQLLGRYSTLQIMVVFITEFLRGFNKALFSKH